MSRDGDAVLAHVAAVLPDRGTWTDPAGYRQSLALCVVDAVFSLRATYAATTAALGRYRAVRCASGAEPEADGLRDLVATVEASGGPVAAAGPALFGNRGYAPGTARRGREGVLKSEAIYRAAVSMLDIGIDRIEDLRSDLTGGRAAWLGVRGLGWVSWDYLLMLTGDDGVKADTMVQRFVAGALGLPSVTGERAKTAVTDAAADSSIDARVLDHAIWLYQRERR
jgi:hypothetical protein